MNKKIIKISLAFLVITLSACNCKKTVKTPETNKDVAADVKTVVVEQQKNNDGDKQVNDKEKENSENSQTSKQEKPVKIKTEKDKDLVK